MGGGTPSEAQVEIGPGGPGPGSAQATPPETLPTTLRVHGTIEKYDPSTRVLSLTTPDGPAVFEITSVARIHQGWHTIQLFELERLTGFQATVRYADSAEGPKVQSVRIARSRLRAK